MKQSQRDIVLEQMQKTGRVTRNWCLQGYISRLSAIIFDLKEEGFHIEAFRNGGDQVYVLVEVTPAEVKEPTHPNEILKLHREEKVEKEQEAAKQPKLV